LKINTNVLIVAAHPDDEVLGCGGTISSLSKKGYKVNVMFLADGESSRIKPKLNNLISDRKKSAIKCSKILKTKIYKFCDLPDNQLDTVSFLKIIKLVELAIRETKPEIIFTHFPQDLNIDHKIAGEATITAARSYVNKIKKILFFEILSSTEQKNSIKESIFCPNYYYDIDSTLSLKISGMKQYKKELNTFPNPRSIEGIKILSKYRGMSSGCKNAEAFQIFRFVE
tara:strand:- start:3892 stop:4572 length:681 start_codon:yes stop_codon:yes gene_type:complete